MICVDASREIGSISFFSKCENLRLSRPLSPPCSRLNPRYPVDTGLFVSGAMDGVVKVWDTNTLGVVLEFDFKDKVGMRDEERDIEIREGREEGERN